ncbi:MAG: hypothetical protein LBI28_04705 [Treponema sp.]|jgi:hypothetical protein|nr:hypothetical protein [Treponema sp.]
MAKVTKAKTSKTKAPAKRQVKRSSTLDNLAKDLKALIPKLDEEGLAFLVKQAQVHLYNMQVDALNETMIKDERRKSTNINTTKTSKTSKTVKPAKQTGVFKDIKASDAGYHVLCNTQWTAFTSAEMTAMVKIIKSEDTDLEIRGRLYSWLLHERSDLLITASISSKFDDNLKSLVTLINNNFKLKG